MIIPNQLGKAVAAVTGFLKSEGVETARLDARLIVTGACGLEPQSVLVKPDYEISAEDMLRVTKMTERRMQREPLSHILEIREFWSLDFKVSADTLTPRADTETLIEAVLKNITTDGAIDILDLGTGSGCILLTLLTELPKAKGVGIDISEAAINIARINSTNLGLSERVSFQQGSWSDAVHDEFDVVVSNPPYIPTKTILELEPEVATFEPKLALDGGEDGLDAYRAIAKDLPRLLKPSGIACFEVGINQANVVGDILLSAGFGYFEIAADLGAIERIVMVKKDF